MNGAGTHPASSPLASLVNEQQLGSARGQLAIGIAGIVLAAVLIIGQITLATTKGIATHLHATVQHMQEGNTVMVSVIERSQPTTVLEAKLGEQAVTLAQTQRALVQTNEQLDAIGVARSSLLDVVGQMRATSTGLAGGVAGVSTSTSTMAQQLSTLPDATTHTHAKLRRIGNDTRAINEEISAIGGKLDRYGLPRARGARTG